MIYASFVNTDNAERAVGALLDHGVDAKNINLVLNERYDIEKPSSSDMMDHAKAGITVTTAADAASGAAKGAGVGVGIGVLAGVASILVPGFGLVIGGGALAAMLTGVAGTTVAGALAGGAMGYLKDQGIPDTMLERYNETVRDGGAVIGVFMPVDTTITDNRGITIHTIEEILAKYGGTDVSRGPVTGRAVVETDVIVPEEARAM